VRQPSLHCNGLVKEFEALLQEFHRTGAEGPARLAPISIAGMANGFWPSAIDRFAETPIPYNKGPHPGGNARFC
jgi:hypothetical protein